MQLPAPIFAGLSGIAIPTNPTDVNATIAFANSGEHVLRECGPELRSLSANSGFGTPTVNAEGRRSLVLGAGSLWSSRC